MRRGLLYSQIYHAPHALCTSVQGLELHLPTSDYGRINSSWADLLPSGTGEYSGNTGFAFSDFKGVIPGTLSAFPCDTVVAVRGWRVRGEQIRTGPVPLPHVTLRLPSSLPP